MMDDIYSVVDDVVAEGKLDFDLRFLILGDFLFSISSCDMRDPADLVLKTTRDFYFSRIERRARLNETLNCEFDKYIVLHQKLLIGLRLIERVKRSVVRSRKEGL
jgi:hypothetical protein